MRVTNLADAIEERLEELMFEWLASERGSDSGTLTRTRPLTAFTAIFLPELPSIRCLFDWCSIAPTDPQRLLLPSCFRRLGAKVDLIGNAPDGRNINLHCGSLHLEGLAGGAFLKRARMQALRLTAMQIALCLFPIPEN